MPCDCHVAANADTHRLLAKTKRWQVRLTKFGILRKSHSGNNHHVISNELLWHSAARGENLNAMPGRVYKFSPHPQRHVLCRLVEMTYFFGSPMLVHIQNLEQPYGNVVSTLPRSSASLRQTKRRYNIKFLRSRLQANKIPGPIRILCSIFYGLPGRKHRWI